MKKILTAAKIGAICLAMALSAIPLLTACAVDRAHTAPTAQTDRRPPIQTTAPLTTPAQPPRTDGPPVVETFPGAAYCYDPYIFDRLAGDYAQDTRRLVDAITAYDRSVVLSADAASVILSNIAFEYPPAALCDFVLNGDTVEITYLYSEADHARRLAAFASAVNRALSILSDTDGEARRATLLYRYVVENVAYFTTDYTDREITAFSALTAGKTICYGFADAFGYLLRQTGMEAHLWRGGTMTADGFSDHGWCYAKVEGSFYHFDPTWERSLYKVSHIHTDHYFGLSDSARFTSLLKSCVSGFGALEHDCPTTLAPQRLSPVE